MFTPSVADTCDLLLIYWLLSQMVLQNVDKAQVKLRMKKDNVAGMYTGRVREEEVRQMDQTPQFIACFWSGLASYSDLHPCVCYLWHEIIETHHVLWHVLKKLQESLSPALFFMCVTCLDIRCMLRAQQNNSQGSLFPQDVSTILAAYCLA